MSGPLEGVRLVEIAGLGPGPFAGMMLADAGADIIRIDRSEHATYPLGGTADSDILNRGRRSVAVDLKHPEGTELVLRLVEAADGLIEGFRPGVAERLGIGPDVCLARNSAIVYARMTGWGQEGPLARMAGHDIDYIAISGALGHIGRAGEKPVAPLNLVGDFGGGGMLLAFGMVSALLHARQSGVGQVLDVAMLDGVAAMMAMTYSLRATDRWNGNRGTNVLDTGAHFYEVYETADGGYFAVGAIEPQFYAELIDLLGLNSEDLPRQMDRDSWPIMKKLFAEAFLTRTRDEWAEVFQGTDACAVPVLTMDEAPRHPQNVHRGTFVEIDGLVQPSPAPRFSRTPGSIKNPPPHPGQFGDQALLDWGLDREEITRLRASGAVR